MNLPLLFEPSAHVRVDIRVEATGRLVPLALQAGVLLLVRQRTSHNPSPLVSLGSRCVAETPGWYELRIHGLTPVPQSLRVRGPLWVTSVEDLHGVGAITVLEGADGVSDSPAFISELAVVRASPSGFILANEQLLEPFAVAAASRDLLKSFTSSDAGEEALRIGAVMPILGVPAWTYLVAVLAAGETLETFSEVIGGSTHVEGFYPYRPPVVIADGEALQDWHPDPHRRILASLAHDGWVRAALHSLEVWGGLRLPLLVLERVAARDVPSPPIINPPFELE